MRRRDEGEKFYLFLNRCNCSGSGGIIVADGSSDALAAPNLHQLHLCPHLGDESVGQHVLCARGHVVMIENTFCNVGKVKG